MHIKSLLDLLEGVSHFDRAAPQGEDTILPAATLRKENGGYTLRMLLAGVKKQDIKLEVEGRYLEITAERKAPEDYPSRISDEFSYGKLFRKINLGGLEGLDLSKELEATFEDGLLTILFPVAQRKTSVTIR